MFLKNMQVFNTEHKFYKNIIVNLGLQGLAPVTKCLWRNFFVTHLPKEELWGTFLLDPMKPVQKESKNSSNEVKYSVFIEPMRICVQYCIHQ